MKKLFMYSLVFMCFNKVIAQQGVVFKIKYIPSRTYNMAIKLGVKVNATLSGDQQLMNTLTAQGFQQPLKADIQAGLNVNMKSGALSSDQTFPLNMDYKFTDLSVAVNGKQIPMPPKITESDIKTVLTVGKDGQMKPDSVNGKKINDTANLKMQQMMNLVQKEIKFPERPLKPGDSFTQEMPMKIPFGGNTEMQMNGGVTYKLISIADGKAFFDMLPNFNMNFTVKSTTISVTGAGSGKMIYSIKDNFAISKDGTFSVKIKVTSDKMNIDATAAINSSYTCTIN